MPRKERIRILPEQPLREGSVYELRVEDIKRVKGGLDVVFRHARGDHEGRQHRVLLPEPFLPHSLTARLMAAAGLNASPGALVATGDAVGKIVGAIFAKADDDEWRVVDFEPIRPGTVAASPSQRNARRGPTVDRRPNRDPQSCASASAPHATISDDHSLPGFEPSLNAHLNSAKCEDRAAQA